MEGLPRYFIKNEKYIFGYFEFLIKNINIVIASIFFFYLSIYRLSRNRGINFHHCYRSSVIAEDVRC